MKPKNIANANTLAPVVLNHDAHWAIEPNSAQNLWRIIENTNAKEHRVDFEARGGNSGGIDSDYLVVNGVAIIGISGPMTKSPTSLSGGTSTVRVRRQIRAAVADSDVRSIILQIDSPGGSVSGTEALANDVATAKKQKPVCAYIDDMCCSAAYWVASQCTHVYAGPTALIGSIGTYMVVEDWSRMYENAGVQVHCLSTGKYKGAGVDGTHISEEHLAEWQRTVDELNEHFLSAVCAGRSLDRARVDKVADGRVHVGKAAQKLGLIDGVRTFDAVLSSMSESGKKLRAENDLPSEDEPPAGEFFEDALDSALAAVTGIADRAREINSKRAADGRRLGHRRLDQCRELHESFGQMIHECESLGVSDDNEGAKPQPTDKERRDRLAKALLDVAIAQ